ncbi:unnamed protein product [Allacma fusca]|uniref:Uncharacterized protein n=1 Tax=Allacma fusca TaxID=39272 RepID=A0A8J2KSA3_9HEXA|nr:unnamed protein product [Allacma fusca]
MLDTSGAIQQDFQLCYPLVSDNLSSKWTEAAEKIAAFTLCKKKSLRQFGIVDGENSNTIAAYFMLPALFRSKVKNVTTVDSAKAFIEPLANIEQLSATSEVLTAKVVCKGNLTNLDLQEFFVVFEHRAIQTETLLSAVG